LSVAVVTQTLVILAKRGGGNTDTVVVLVALRRNGLIEVEGDRAQASQIGQRPPTTNKQTKAEEKGDVRA
jgi:hypothetical protein